ncbi:hypothetical protein F5I97DRAFT_1909772 [Phlebopus sp. FC_14]|nr:hypothetical protein F5I97DRAFT_1909772 [Phlebopus sp. FC_14]
MRVCSSSWVTASRCEYKPHSASFVWPYDPCMLLACPRGGHLMLPFALKAVWFVLSFTGIIACWIVLTIFSRAIGSTWGPMLYSIFATILQGMFCLGMIYEMDPYQMPETFCIAQTFIIYYAAYSLTGVCAAFTFATAGSVLWPCSTVTSATSALAWHPRYLLPIVVFPLACFAIAVPILLELDAIQPSDDLHCDVSNPVWGRFLGYAGLSNFLSIPCFFLSAAAAFRVFHMHLDQQRTGIFKHAINQSHSHSHLQSSNDGTTSTPHFTAPISPPGPLFTASSDADPETDTGQLRTEQRERTHRDLPRLITDNEGLSGSQSHVFTSPVSASPLSSPHVSKRHSVAMEKGPNDVEALSPRLATGTMFSPSATGRSRRSSTRHMKTSLAPAVWRLILFQMAFFSIQLLAALSTIIDVAKHHSTPTPFGTQHVALVLVGWGPSVVFGHLPAVRRRLMFWRRSE